MSAPILPLKPRPLRTMVDMGMALGGMGAVRGMAGMNGLLSAMMHKSSVSHERISVSFR